MTLLTSIHNACNTIPSGTSEQSTQDADGLLAGVDAILTHEGLTTEEKYARLRELFHLPRVRANINSLAWAVWSKTGGLCSYCCSPLNPFNRSADNGFNMDHVVPFSRGGPDTVDNLVPACRRCNLVKAAQVDGRHD